MNPTRLVTALAVTATLTLAGCSDNPDPKLAPATTSTPAVQSTAPTADPKPVERDFVSDYIIGISDALSSGDPSGFMQMSAATCRNCQTFASNIEKAFSDGGQIRHGMWSVTEMKQVKVTDEGALWFVDVDAAAERWVDAQGRVVKRVPAGRQLLSITVGGDPGSPEVRDISFRTP